MATECGDAVCCVVVRMVFKLLASESESIRLHAVKLLGYFLMRSTTR